MPKLQLLFAAAILLLPGSSTAEVYQCNGVWTSAPCDGGQAVSVPPKEISRDRQLMRQKQSLVTDAELRLLKAREAAGAQFNVTSIIRPLADYCAGAEVSLEHCRERVKSDEQSAADEIKQLAKPVETPAPDPIENPDGVDVAVSGPGYTNTIKPKRPGEKSAPIKIKPVAVQDISGGARVRVPGK